MVKIGFVMLITGLFFNFFFVVTNTTESKITSALGTLTTLFVSLGLAMFFIISDLIEDNIYGIMFQMLVVIIVFFLGYLAGEYSELARRIRDSKRGR